MAIPAKATWAWLLLFVVMFANGAIRVGLLEPQLGEDHARQVASVSGVALVLLVSWLFSVWWGPWLGGIARARRTEEPARLSG